MIQLRPAHSDEAVRLAALEARSTDWPWSERQYLDSLHAGHDVVVLEVDGVLAGVAVTQTVLDEAELLTLSVAPEYRGQGWGKQLLLSRMTELKAGGACRLMLEVREGNTRARGLYTHLGFTECGRRRAYYPAAAGREDAILMEIPL